MAIFPTSRKDWSHRELLVESPEKERERIMTDKTTGKPLRVSTNGRSGPYLVVPVDQMSAVRGVLDRAGIRYWVDETAVSVDGKPAMTVVNFGKTMNPKEIQSELDRVA
jgi:hypothetical protein